jgi:hypothetical protein
MHNGRLNLIVETFKTPGVKLAPHSLQAAGGSGRLSPTILWSTPLSASGSSPVAIAIVIIQAYFKLPVHAFIAALSPGSWPDPIPEHETLSPDSESISVNFV